MESGTGREVLVLAETPDARILKLPEPYEQTNRRESTARREQRAMDWFGIAQPRPGRIVAAHR